MVCPVIQELGVALNDRAARALRRRASFQGVRRQFRVSQDFRRQQKIGRPELGARKRSQVVREHHQKRGRSLMQLLLQPFGNLPPFQWAASNRLVNP